MIRPFAAALVLALSATGAWADRWSDCNQDKDPDRSIRACTQIIERGKRENQETRAAAYFNRGNAYVVKAEDNRAIANYDKGIALNPNYAYGYTLRGVTYLLMGEQDRAIADLRKALEIDASDIAAKAALKSLGVTP